MPSLSRPRCGLALLLSLLAGACVDGTPLSPSIEDGPFAGIPVLQCVADVRAEQMDCSPVEQATVNQSIAANRLLGGQDIYVRLANDGIRYDAGAEIFYTDVTVQNLLQKPIGTTDGTTVSGVRVFFASGPNLSGVGSGEVTVRNEDGEDFFTAAGQEYFLYPQILQPYQISNAKTWQFNAPATAPRFSFIVYVATSQSPSDVALPPLDRVWTGLVSGGDWTTAGNWSGGVPPDSGSVVSVPRSSLMQGTHMPVLAADAQLTALAMGTGSSMSLGGHVLTAWGTVDLAGTMSSGTLRMRGNGAFLRGTVPALEVIADDVVLQGAATATGPVTISGELTLSNYNPLTIINPTSP